VAAYFTDCQIQLCISRNRGLRYFFAGAAISSPDVPDFDGKHGLSQRGTVDKLCSKDATPSPEQIGQLRRYFSRITKSWEEYPEARAALWPVLAQYPSKGQFKYMRN
jgi:hypothetical protein